MSWNEATNKGVLEWEKQVDKVTCPVELWDGFYPEFATCSDDQERDDMIAITLYRLDELGIKPNITLNGEIIGKGVYNV